MADIQLFRERLSEKVHATIPKGIVGGFEFAVLQRNLKEWHKRPWELMGVCLRVLKESNKRSFDSYSVWNSVLIISHITFRDRRVHIFADNLSRNSCIPMSCSVLFKLRNRFENMIETELLMCSRYSSQEINLTCLYVLLL